MQIRYQNGKCPFRNARGHRQAVQRRCRARTTPLFCISVGFSCGACACLGARERSERVTGAASAAPVSFAADLYQDKHTPCCHTRNFSVSKGYIRGYKMPRLYSRSQRLSALHIEQCSLPLSLTGKHCMIDAQKKGEAERLLPMRQTLIKSESLQR